MKSVFSQVHHQCQLHGENFYITLANVFHIYNKNVSVFYIVVILVKIAGGRFPPLHTLFGV